MNILLDVDDTLTDFVHTRNNLIKKYIEDKKLPYKILDINCTKSAKVADWPLEECCKFWAEVGREAQLNCPCQSGAAEVVRKLKEQGHNIIIVTARPDIYFEAEPYTKLWLQKQGIPFDKIIVGKQDKKQTMIDNNINLVIDDSVQTITYASELGINSLMYTTEENKQQKPPRYCTRVNSWEEIDQILEVKTYSI